MLPATKCGLLNALPASSVAGKFFCVLTMAIGSSFPTYVPAILWSLSVDADTITSPSGDTTE